MYLLQRATSSARQIEAYHNGIIPLSHGGIALIATNAALVTLVTVWTALRFYSRKIMGFGLMAEDYWHVCALLAFYGLAVLGILMVLFGGFGHHMAELEHSRVELSLKIGFAIRIVYFVALGLVKIGSCVMISRIFSMPSIKLMARILIGLICCWIAATVLTGFLICRPLKRVWDPFMSGGKCGSQIMVFASLGIVNVVTDLFILLVPLPVVLKLELPRTSKIGLLVIFCLGIVTMFFGSVRIALIFNVSFVDFTYSGKTLQIVTVCEVAVALMVTSTPMLRPLFDRVPPHSRISMIRKSYNSGGSSYTYGQEFDTPRASMRSSLGPTSQVCTPIGEKDTKSSIAHVETSEVSELEAYRLGKSKYTGDYSYFDV